MTNKRPTTRKARANVDGQKLLTSLRNAARELSSLDIKALNSKAARPSVYAKDAGMVNSSRVCRIAPEHQTLSADKWIAVLAQRDKYARELARFAKRVETILAEEG